jgi:hypothetical protein
MCAAGTAPMFSPTSATMFGVYTTEMAVLVMKALINNLSGYR